MAKKNGQNETENDELETPEPPRASKKVALKTFLDDPAVNRQYGAATVRAFGQFYRTEPAKDDWSVLLDEFVKKPR